MSGPVLTSSFGLRMSAFTALYLAQGVPIGLFSIALPAWLVEQGADAADIAALVAVTGLPWAFKLIAGPFMDRFSFPAMGRRRPWVMGAQAGFTVSMVSLALVSGPSDGLWPIMVIGFVINTFAAVQDVAVDGMAIDVLPISERGRANAFMAFGQAAGFSGFGALDGYLLSRFGLGVTAIVSAAAIGAVLVFVAVTREREGERLLPWTAGMATAREIAPARSMLEILRDILRVLLLPMSLLLIAVEFLARAGSGVGLAIMPVLAVDELGYASEVYAYWLGLMGGLSAFVGIFCGPAIDRLGARKVLVVGLLGGSLVTVAYALAAGARGTAGFDLTMLAAAQIFGQVFFVSMIAMFMGICWARVAATQFAIYMSLANLARSAGAGAFALVATDLSVFDALYLVAALSVAAVLLLQRFDPAAHAARLALIDEERLAPRQTERESRTPTP
ncbi:MAG TPA: MFS transporter [Pseudomonadales bacterium]